MILIIVSSCKKVDREYTYDDINFAEEMRSFVINISKYAKDFQPNFIVIPQNGVQLTTVNTSIAGDIHEAYVAAIDGQGQEGLFYGYEEDDVATSLQATDYLKSFLDLLKSSNKQILVTDYCKNPVFISDSYHKIDSFGYIGYVATERELNIISPIPIHLENNNDIDSLNDAQNFLYLLNSDLYTSKDVFIKALQNTNYDVIIMDLFFNDGSIFSQQDILSLKTKLNGGKRLIISYMSIGEAEDYRYYWQTEWDTEKPIWLDQENEEWPGNYKVKYWEEEWQEIIYGNNESYTKKIIDAGFDGVYLDIIDAFEFFEERY